MKNACSCLHHQKERTCTSPGRNIQNYFLVLLSGDLLSYFCSKCCMVRHFSDLLRKEKNGNIFIAAYLHLGVLLKNLFFPQQANTTSVPASLTETLLSGCLEIVSLVFTDEAWKQISKIENATFISSEIKLIQPWKHGQASTCKADRKFPASFPFTAVLQVQTGMRQDITKIIFQHFVCTSPWFFLTVLWGGNCSGIRTELTFSALNMQNEPGTVLLENWICTCVNYVFTFGKLVSVLLDNKAAKMYSCIHKVGRAIL